MVAKGKVVGYSSIPARDGKQASFFVDYLLYSEGDQYFYGMRTNKSWLPSEVVSGDFLKACVDQDLVCDFHFSGDLQRPRLVGINARDN